MEDEGLRRRQQDDIMGALNGRIRHRLREMAMEEQRARGEGRPARRSDAVALLVSERDAGARRRVR